MRAAVVVAWCQPTPTKEEDISLPLFCFQFAFTFLLAGTIGFRAVPVNSPPSPARVEQQQLGNIWPPQSARLPVPPPARLGSLLWKLVESLPSFVSEGEGKKKEDRTEEAGETLERVVCKCCF